MTKFVFVCVCTYRSEKTLIVSKTVFTSSPSNDRSDFIYLCFLSLDINIDLTFKFKHRPLIQVLVILNQHRQIFRQVFLYHVNFNCAAYCDFPTVILTACF